MNSLGYIILNLAWKAVQMITWKTIAVIFCQSYMQYFIIIDMCLILTYWKQVMPL